MKCPVCWSNKAYYRQPRGWIDRLPRLLLLVPLKCHHCFHKFHVPWFLTWGKELEPPVMRQASDAPTRPSVAQRHFATTATNDRQAECGERANPRGRTPDANCSPAT
jgi:hypothetical protein